MRNFLQKSRRFKYKLVFDDPTGALSVDPADIKNFGPKKKYVAECQGGAVNFNCEFQAGWDDTPQRSNSAVTINFNSGTSTLTFYYIGFDGDNIIVRSANVNANIINLGANGIIYKIYEVLT